MRATKRKRERPCIMCSNFAQALHAPLLPSFGVGAGKWAIMASSRQGSSFESRGNNMQYATGNMQRAICNRQAHANMCPYVPSGRQVLHISYFILHIVLEFEIHTLYFMFAPEHIKLLRSIFIFHVTLFWVDDPFVNIRQ